MFPSSVDQTNEKCFKIIPSCTTSFAEVTTPQQDCIFGSLQDFEQVETIVDVSTTPPRKPTERRSDVGENNTGKGKKEKNATTISSPDKHSLKKMVHRDVERQRRLEMSKLYSSLKSTLPPEFIKAKRSVTDHMLDAVDYIKHMQERINGLNMKRDKVKKYLKATADAANNNVASESSTNTVEQHPPNTVSLRSCHDGVEILIDSCFIEEGFPLSEVLRVLSQEGLIVLSFIYTRVNDRLRHTIQSEVHNQTFIDLSMLQEKLTSVINSKASRIST